MAQETTNNYSLTCKACIWSLKCKLNALCHPKVFDDIKVPHTKGYHPVPPVTKEPIASSSVPIPSTIMLLSDKGKEKETALTIASEPPLRLFSSIPNCYAPPAQKNFAMSDKCQDATYQTMPPIYDIEQTKVVFDRYFRQR